MKNIGDKVVCQKSCMNLDALPRNFSYKSKPCPPSNEFNLDSKDCESKLNLIVMIEQLTLMEMGKIWARVPYVPPPSISFFFFLVCLFSLKIIILLPYYICNNDFFFFFFTNMFPVILFFEGNRSSLNVVSCLVFHMYPSGLLKFKALILLIFLTFLFCFVQFGRIC